MQIKLFIQTGPYAIVRCYHLVLSLLTNSVLGMVDLLNCLIIDILFSKGACNYLVQVVNFCIFIYSNSRILIDEMRSYYIFLISEI